jgi:antitoxin YefM
MRGVLRESLDEIIARYAQSAKQATSVVVPYRTAFLYNLMPETISYSEARANLASLWDRVVDSREPVVIQRRGKEPVAVLPAAELEAIMETAHLLRSPRNAERLLAALNRAREQAGEPSTVESLREEAGLG